MSETSREVSRLLDPIDGICARSSADVYEVAGEFHIGTRFGGLNTRVVTSCRPSMLSWCLEGIDADSVGTKADDIGSTPLIVWEEYSLPLPLFPARNRDDGRDSMYLRNGISTGRGGVGRGLEIRRETGLFSV